MCTAVPCPCAAFAHLLPMKNLPRNILSFSLRKIQYVHTNRRMFPFFYSFFHTPSLTLSSPLLQYKSGYLFLSYLLSDFYLSLSLSLPHYLYLLSHFIPLCCFEDGCKGSDSLISIDKMNTYGESV